MAAKMTNLSKALLLGSVLAVGMPFAAAVPQEAPAATTQAPPSIKVVTAEKRELVETLTVTGSIIARDEAAVGTDVAGLLVEQLNADDGDMVKKGDVLAVLDRRALETQLVQAEASRAQAEAAAAQTEASIADAEVALRQANEGLSRAKKLQTRGVSSNAEFDNATNASDSAKAKLLMAQRALTASNAQLAVIDAQKQNVQVQLDKTQVRAPADGLILKRNVTLGSIVSGSAGPLFRIAVDNEFELSADVAETSLARLAKGQKVAVHLAGLDRPLQGTIRRVSPEIDSASRLGSIRVTVEKSDRLRVGNFARGVVEVARQEIVAVPDSAVIYQDRQALLQVVRDGKVHTTPVSVGIHAADMVGVTEGLQAGDEVVARAGTFVADGDMVTPVRDEVKTGSLNP